jgi:hypothetical protein
MFRDESGRLLPVPSVETLREYIRKIRQQEKESY